MSSLRFLRSPARGLLSLVVVLATQVLMFAAPAPSSAASANSVTVELSSLSPAVAVKNGTLHLAGTLLGGSSAHSEVAVRLAVAQMQVRSDLTSNAGTGSRLVYGHDDSVGNLAPGASVPWTLTMPISALSLTSRTVYALDIEAYSGDLRIGALRTYLPYEMTGDSSFHATQMVMLLPITAVPALDGQVDKDVPEAASDALSAQFASGGRLDQMLTIPTTNKSVTVSWAIDPDLLTTADEESHGYSLYPDSHSGTGAQNAANWLTTAKRVLGVSGELWQLPAADPDLGSLGHTSPALAAGLVKSATARSGDLVEQYVGHAPLGTVAWPADGQADSGTIALAAAANPAAIVVRSDSVSLHTPLDSYTPTGRTQLAGRPAAISDAALDAIFAGDAADTSWKGSNRSLLAAQRFLADSALIAWERPNLAVPRTIMVAVPRGISPDPALFTAVGQASWIKTVGLSALLAAHPDPRAQTSPAKRDPALAKSDLSNARLATTSALNSALGALAGIMIEPQQTTGSYGPAVLRTVSTAWRNAPALQSAFSGAVQNRLETTMNLVTLVKKSDLTLSGKSGVIPFTVENRLEHPVRVGIRITTSRPGLSVQTITVQDVPQGSTTINVHVSSAVTGTRVTVTAQLVTPNGADYGQPQSLQVTVSSIGSITLVIFALSAALLVIAVGLRIYRGRRTRTPQAVPDPSGASVDSGALAEAEREQ
ncbi:hypothetical protein KGA66_03670 [Actinocrinis puniceicyclus]|uniref:Uncharacterized protein n=1 Tax=Actinocrinis puniceicyclus TaxID=977794 RepID=A0A8J7WH35_9ACTN|nr:DUF6049 family protein [Actinocrinis puniceicyclus]MBS2962131.1 hypothetical protein [Actinocrinis puniceicyclus]